MATDYDIVVVGGGINGCGIARDAAGRGFSVALFEQNDLACGTSSASTKLIHGGLRYLEHYEFRLVREALKEREVLWHMAPHIIWPLRFVLPYHSGLRPAWMLRTGLFLYDHLGGRDDLPGTQTVNLRGSPLGRPLKPIFSSGFEYSDCWVEDARLVVLNAQDAQARGARIETRSEVIRLLRDGEAWRVDIRHVDTGVEETCSARLVVNAAGPWVDEVLRGPVGRNQVSNVRLVKGSHIVVRKIYEHDRAYIFQNADGRIVFAIPYERDFTLIGTTDEDYTGDPADVAISQKEVEYLCQAASEYFEDAVSYADIVWTYSGVRPLYDDGASKAQEATRDYVLKRDGSSGEAKLINIFGGKITTYRKLAESAMEMVEDELGARGNEWTEGATLPGGDFAPEAFDALVGELRQSCEGCDDELAIRLARAYGTRAHEIFHGSNGELGQHFGAGLYEAEVDYLAAHEWARTAEDIVWRRSKLGLRMDKLQIEALDQYLRNEAPGADMSTAAAGGRHA